MRAQKHQLIHRNQLFPAQPSYINIFVQRSNHLFQVPLLAPYPMRAHEPNHQSNLNLLKGRLPIFVFSYPWTQSKGCKRVLEPKYSIYLSKGLTILFQSFEGKGVTQGRKFKALCLQPWNWDQWTKTRDFKLSF